MANKEFLEKYPLYKKYPSNLEWFSSITSGIQADQMQKPAIKVFCSVCKSDQTFNMVNEYYDTYANEIVGNSIRQLIYKCASCGRGTYHYLVLFLIAEKDKSKNHYILEKVGQFPAWSIDMEKDLESILEDNAQYYKKGLVCESQGYGIGAHAYYRRIVEDVIGELLESIGEHISSKDELKHYNEAMESVRKTRVAQEKIELVKDLLPTSLQPNGINPLQVIYDELSEGIHYNSDEECLESADAIRVSIAYLANQVMKKKTDHQNFTDSMKKMLDKKAKKIADKNTEIKE